MKTNNKELQEIFKELLSEWENSEEIVINDRGVSEDYEELENRKEKYIKKFDEALENN